VDGLPGTSVIEQSKRAYAGKKVEDMTAEEEMEAYAQANKIHGLEHKVLQIFEEGYNESKEPDKYQMNPTMQLSK
jgi:hypothetical protein